MEVLNLAKLCDSCPAHRIHKVLTRMRTYRFADIRVGFAATCIDSVASNYQPLSFGSHIHTLNRTAVLVCGYVQYMCAIVLQSCEVQNLVPY